MIWASMVSQSSDLGLSPGSRTIEQIPTTPWESGSRERRPTKQRPCEQNVSTAVREQRVWSETNWRSNCFTRTQSPISGLWCTAWFVRISPTSRLLFTLIDEVKPIHADMDQMKCTIHSGHGCIMVIPRGNDSVRLYVQITSSADKGSDGNRKPREDEVQASAKILLPYKIGWDRVEWYLVSPVG